MGSLPAPIRYHRRSRRALSSPDFYTSVIAAPCVLQSLIELLRSALAGYMGGNKAWDSSVVSCSP